MKSIILLFLLLPFLLTFDTDRKRNKHLSSSREYFTVPKYASLESQCTAIIAILDGPHSGAKDAEYKAKMQQLEEAYLTAIKATPADKTTLENSMKAFTTVIEGDNGKEQAFYTRAAQQKDKLQEVLTNFKAEAQAIFSLLNNLADNKATEFSSARSEFQTKVLAEKSALATEEQAGIDAFLTEMNKSFDDALTQYNTIRIAQSQQTAPSKAPTESEKKAESNNAASEALKQKTESERLSEKLAADKALAKAIETAIASSMPPEFCWRGNNPQCPTSHPGRSGLLCYRDCEAVKQEDINDLKTRNKLSDAEKLGRKSYKLWGGVCWEDCDSYKSPTTEPYKSIGLVCRSKKHWYHWHTRRSFVTSSVTNYNSGAVCPDGKPKSWFLGLCYRSCSEFGYVDCGAGACALDNKSCAKEITNIVAGTLIGITEVVLFGLSMGSSGVLKEAVKGVEEIAKKVIAGTELLTELIPKFYDRYEVAEKVFANPTLKANVLKDCKAKARVLLENFPEKIAEIDAKCTAKVDAMEPEVRTKKQAIKTLATEVAKESFKSASVETINTLIGTVAENVPDVKILFGLYSGYKDCKHLMQAGSTASENDKIQCVKAGLDIVSAVEPTGIVGLINTFVYPSCRSALLDQVNSVTHKKP